ncbi:MAG TPA: hypothetical protein VK509_17375, partial [Polyangiales bacterium]|nr:hypothetical protein [Polyangiales bacterium]
TDGVLRDALQQGVGAVGLERSAALLGVAGSEPAFARALVRKLATAQIAAVHAPLRAAPASHTPVENGAQPRAAGDRASLVLRPSLLDERAGGQLDRMQDLRALLALLRAGSLPQRRAAVLRLGELIAEGNQPPEHVRAAETMLAELRSFPIAYELWHVRAGSSGAVGREARSEGERWNELAAAYERDVLAFWDGASADEPTQALADDARAQLLARTRDLSDVAVRHLCAVVQGCDGASNRDARASLLRALRHAGDARLVPALHATLDGEELDLAALAARALSAIADPRVDAVLSAAYERTSAPDLRLVLAHALAVQGDARALGYVRRAIASSDERLLPRALEALAELGGRDDARGLTVVLGGQRDPRVVSAAVRALGRIADGRALIPLAELRTPEASSALLAEIEEAELAIRSRMELLGEEAPARALAAHGFDTAKHTALVRRKDPALVRMRALWSYLLGRTWLALGASNSGIARLEAAAALRPDWVAPVLALAVFAARRSELAQALPAFRRVLGIDRTAIERSHTAARLMAQTFLRRAEAMARDGRDEIARGLLEEALAFDLRKAPSALRFALEQRQQALEAKQLRGGSV